MIATATHHSIHVDPEGLVSAESRCPACESRRPRPRMWRLHEDPEVWLLQCSECGAASASHMPRTSDQEVCPVECWDAIHSTTTIDEADQIARRIMRGIFVWRLPQRVRLLDIGGGTLGLALARQMLAAREDYTVELTLVDYDEPLFIGHSRRLHVMHHHSLDALDGKFEIVLANAVLEHIPRLKSAMERFFSLVTHGGWFFARTPWLTPLKRLNPDIDLTYPGNVHDLGAPFWNRVPKRFEHSIRVVASQPSPIEAHLSHSHRRANPSWLIQSNPRIAHRRNPSKRSPVWRLMGGWEVLLQCRQEGYDAQSIEALCGDISQFVAA